MQKKTPVWILGKKLPTFIFVVTLWGFRGWLKITIVFAANEADEVRLALDWQGFVVDIGEVDALVHEVGQRQGLNQPGA